MYVFNISILTEFDDSLTLIDEFDNEPKSNLILKAFSLFLDLEQKRANYF